MVQDSTNIEQRKCTKCGKQITTLAIRLEESIIALTTDMQLKATNISGKIIRKIKSGSEFNKKINRYVHRLQDSDMQLGGLYKKRVSYIDDKGNEIVIKDQVELEAHHKPDHLKKASKTIKL